MTLDEIRAAFAAGHPKAVDFPLSEIENSAPEDFKAAAEEYGYRLAGTRLGRWVFTTKPVRGGTA